MPGPRCSSPVSRKSLVRVLAAALLVLTPAVLPAQLQHEARILADEDHLSVTVVAAGADIEELFSTLRSGMRVRVEYRVRVSEPRSQPFRALGDRLLEEFRPGVEAGWDPFRASYVLTDHDGSIALFQDETAFYTRLFTLDDYRIPWEAIPAPAGLVVEASAEYTPIVFVPGLSILSLFTANRSESSQWSRHEVSPTTGRATEGRP